MLQLRLPLHPVLQILAFYALGQLYFIVWKIPTYYIGHRIDTHHQTSHIFTTCVILKALTFQYLYRILPAILFGYIYMKCFNQMIELFNIRSIAVVLPEVLLLFSCGLIDITDVVCQYFNRLSVTKDIDDIDVAPIVPMHTPMRKTIEQVAQKYNVLPKTWNEKSLRCCATTNAACNGTNASAVGSTLIIPSNYQSIQPRQIVAIALHEFGHMKKNHVEKDNQARVLVHMLRALLVALITTYLKDESVHPVIHPVVGYLSVKCLIVQPMFDPFIRCVLNYIAHQHELEADEIACECNYEDALYAALTKEKKLNQETVPSVMYSYLYSNHPTIETRQTAILNYKKRKNM